MAAQQERQRRREVPPSSSRQRAQGKRKQGANKGTVLLFALVCEKQAKTKLTSYPIPLELRGPPGEIPGVKVQLSSRPLLFRKSKASAFFCLRPEVFPGVNTALFDLACPESCKSAESLASPRYIIGGLPQDELLRKVDFLQKHWGCDAGRHPRVNQKRSGKCLNGRELLF
ncbi:MAG: hypothetical protein QHH75_15325 [Bacillota bacterium]|nr:hypothetical protein [Bacillota bacterium]